MATRADLSRITLRSVREMVHNADLYGVTPASALRTSSIITTETLKATSEKKQSAISKANRLPGPRKETYVASQGAINFESLFCREFDEFLEEGFCDTFVIINVSSDEISFDADDDSINDESAAGTLFASIPKGCWIPIAGATTPGNNTGDDWAYVSSKPSARKLVLSFHPLADEPAGATIEISSRVLRDGTKLISRTYEREHEDLSANAFWSYPGVIINELGLNFNFEDLIKGTANVTGRRPVGPVNATVGTGAHVAPVDITHLFDVTNNMKAFRTGPDGVAALDGNLKNLSISLKNNAEAIRLAMQGTPVGQSLGTAGLDGTVEGILLENDGRQAIAAGDDYDGYSFRITDPLEQTYYFTIWRLKYNEKGDVTKSGANGPGMHALPYTAEEEPSIGHWIQCCASPQAV